MISTFFLIESCIVLPRSIVRVLCLIKFTDAIWLKLFSQLSIFWVHLSLRTARDYLLPFILLPDWSNVSPTRRTFCDVPLLIFISPNNDKLTVGNSHCDVVFAIIKHVWSCLLWASQAFLSHRLSLCSRWLSFFSSIRVPFFLNMFPDIKPEARPEGYNSDSSVEIAGNNFPMP